jgi:hypothetical protein
MSESNLANRVRTQSQSTAWTVFAALTLMAQLLTTRSAFGQNSDLFPNIKEPPASGQSSGNGNNGNGPVTIDEGGKDESAPLPFIPSPGGVGTPVIPIGQNPGFNPGFAPGFSPGYDNNGSGPNNTIPSNPVNGAFIRVANVPSQYSCPLFENSSYQDLNIAIQSLTNAIQGVSDQCQSSQPQVESVKQTSEQIRKSIHELQGYVQNPQAGYESLNQMQNNVSQLITGIDRMSEVFRNVSTLSNSCGHRNLSWGRVALELNNVINSASPFLLLLAATQPALSLAVKGAIMGTVVGSNVISTMAQVIQNNTVKMEIADQRNAVLQNTCQFTKVAKKISYIQLARSGRFQELEKQLKDNVTTYGLKISGGSRLLNQMWNIRGNFRNNIGGLQAAVRSDKEALEEINLRIRESQNNALLICIQGKQLVQMAQEESAFPNSVQLGILNAYQQNNYLKNIDLTDFQAAYGQPRLNRGEEDEKLKRRVQTLIRTYQTLLNRMVNFPEDPIGEQVSSCAATTMAFVQHISRMIVETTNILVEDLDSFEEELAKNEDYRRWKSEFDKVINEQENTNRMARVLKELTKPGSGVYNRSEFAEAAANLKRSLMGPRQNLLSGDSPVFAWLDYKRTQFARSLGNFEKTYTEINRKAFSLTKSGQYMTTISMSSGAFNQMLIDDLEMSRTLNILNKKTLPLNTPQWELACIDLEKAIKDYSDAIDHLGTTHFMCDMIWDYLDNSVDPKITSYCRGQADYSGKQTLRQKSYIDQAMNQLSSKPNSRVLSSQEKANLIARKMVEIGCRLPRAGDN